MPAECCLSSRLVDLHLNKGQDKYNGKQVKQVCVGGGLYMSPRVGLCVCACV